MSIIVLLIFYVQIWITVLALTYSNLNFTDLALLSYNKQ